MKITQFLLHFFLITSIFYLKAGPIITFFFKPAPDAEQIAEKLSRPGKLAKHSVHAITQHPSLSGVCAIYSGYIAVSDEVGEIRFPRKTASPTINLIITPEIKPIPLFENTISHWEVIPTIPTTLYSVSQEYNNETSSYEWITQKVSSLPNNTIPDNSIIILAKPSNISIPTGKSTTNYTANLVLPPIFLKKNSSVARNSTYLLTIRHLFKPVGSKIMHVPFKITTQVIG